MEKRVREQESDDSDDDRKQEELTGLQIKYFKRIAQCIIIHLTTCDGDSEQWSKLNSLLKYPQIREKIISDETAEDNSDLDNFRTRQFGFVGLNNDKAKLEQLKRLRHTTNPGEFRKLVSEEKERIA